MSWDVLIPPTHNLVLLLAVPHLRVPSLKLKQAKGPLPALPVLPSARSVRPSHTLEQSFFVIPLLGLMSTTLSIR